MDYSNTLVEALQATGPQALAILFGAAVLEYVVPPLPGDLVVVASAFYAVHGVLSLPLVFVVATLGSVVGAAIDYEIGRRLGRAAEQRVPEHPRRFQWASRERLHRIEHAYRRYGDFLILLNRFLPGIRGLLFVAAGAAGMPARRVMVLGAVSAAAWNCLLLAAGYAVGENLDQLIGLSRAYGLIVSIAISAVILVTIVVRLIQRRRNRKRSV